MISSHPSFVWPTDQNVKLWRYTDLAKFASLLFTSKLFFSRASFLGDPYEGSITKTQHDLRRYIIANRTVDPSLEMWKDMTDDALRPWHMNEHESAAMWRLYTSASEAVCVQSTFARLSNVLPHYVNAGTVTNEI
jgi:hypothetical protein